MGDSFEKGGLFRSEKWENSSGCVRSRLTSDGCGPSDWPAVAEEYYSKSYVCSRFYGGSTIAVCAKVCSLWSNDKPAVQEVIIMN